MKDDSVEILFKSFLQEALVSSSGLGRDVHSLTLSIQHFLLLSTASPTLQSALQDGFGGAVVACDMPKPCLFLSPDSWQKRFLRAHKNTDLAAHPVFDPVLQVGDAEKFFAPTSEYDEEEVEQLTTSSLTTSSRRFPRRHQCANHEIMIVVVSEMPHWFYIEFRKQVSC